jgi:hypothetical protein
MVQRNILFGEWLFYLVLNQTFFFETQDSLTKRLLNGGIVANFFNALEKSIPARVAPDLYVPIQRASYN